MINARGDILYVHGQTGNYLETSPGEASVSNILKMARDLFAPRPGATMLRHAVTTRKAFEIYQPQGHHQTVNYCLSNRCPSRSGRSEPGPGHALVFGDLRRRTSCSAESSPDCAHPEMPQAEAAARIMPHFRKSSMPKMSTLKHHCHAGNLQRRPAPAIEEMQSSNEELQSVNEGYTVTTELQRRCLICRGRITT
ncbi:MAG: hypothetical protein IPH54_22335 [Rhodoferax sp.]|nr:hypothetical protein [Rhodoferax sp.]